MRGEKALRPGLGNVPSGSPSCAIQAKIGAMKPDTFPTVRRIVPSAIVLVIIIFLSAPLLAQRDRLSLAGDWAFQLDPDDHGAAGEWFLRDLSDSVRLPGTTDTNRKGYPLRREDMSYGIDVLRTVWPGTQPVERADRSGYLVRDWFYIGKAWYQRAIEIPESWSGKRVELRLERVLWESKVWIDGHFAGSCDSLVTEHRYSLGALAPGPHRITIRVDNGLIHNIGIIGHAYGPETQTRWNGIVGRIELEATSPVFVADTQVYPSPDQRSVRVVSIARNTTSGPVPAEFSVHILEADSGRDLGGASGRIVLDSGSDQNIERRVDLNRPADAWGEFNPSRYRVEVELRSPQTVDTRTLHFGFRTLESSRKQIRVNGIPAFLRGTLNCAVFPRTGYPPMDLGSWLTILGRVREYGFNLVRFHSWCPPEEAFEAADRLGIYLAPETPFWVDNWTRDTSSRPGLLGTDPDVLEFVRREVERMSDRYGNHPSFAFFCIGNEFGLDTDWDLVERLLREFKEADPRRLYTATTARRTVASDDFWVTHKSQTHPARGVGPARTDWDFALAVAEATLPLLSHETGQRPVFPDYPALLPKFIGPLKPYDLEYYRDRLAESGREGQLDDFVRASAQFQRVLYKSEHEGMRRTQGLSGYELLMLNDFTGQSEALVGILDPFGDGKGVTSVSDVLEWNGETAILARLPRYLWTAGDDLTAEFRVSHFGSRPLPASGLEWSLKDKSTGSTLVAGSLGPESLEPGRISDFGEIKIPLAAIERPLALELEARMGLCQNHWNLWVYPSGDPAEAPPGVTISSRLDGPTVSALEQGESILLTVPGLEGPHAARGTFLPVYWSAGWWGGRFSSLGILCDPKHPALAEFPNDGHSDWQWSELAEGATTFLLENVPPELQPIVQLVPDFHYPAFLAPLFEVRVGRGRLVVCGFDLSSDLENRHAARQLRASLLHYMASPAFEPAGRVSVEFLRGLLREK